MVAGLGLQTFVSPNFLSVIVISDETVKISPTRTALSMLDISGLRPSTCNDLQRLHPYPSSHRRERGVGGHGLLSSPCLLLFVQFACTKFKWLQVIFGAQMNKPDTSSPPAANGSVAGGGGIVVGKGLFYLRGLSFL